MSDDEHEPPDGPASPASDEGGGQPRAQPSGRARRVRGVLTSRAAGWVVATALAGAVVALSVTAATLRSSPIAVRAPFSVVGPARVSPGDVKLHIRPGGGRVLLLPDGEQIVTPPGGRIQLVPGGPQIVTPPGGKRVFLVPGGPLVSRVLPFAIGSPVSDGQVTTVFGRVVAGTVASVSSPGFTVKTGGGQLVAVVERSSTLYRKAGSPASASVVTRGAKVAVLGSLSGSKFTATVVAVLPA